MNLPSLSVLITYNLTLYSPYFFRALEASIRDTQTSMQQMGVAGPIVDPLNPLERRREGDTPVGLKNIGNTCWFSAVIQVSHAC